MVSQRRGSSVRRGLVALLLVGLFSCLTDAHADDLYRAKTAVTGQGELNRLSGFATCLEDVLIKVSGAAKLAGDPRLEPAKSHAGDFVTTFDYHDQMSGKAKRDEQGTRDRPYDLIVDFDRLKVDELLGSLGLKPWLSHRPTLGVVVTMVPGTRSFFISADGKQSELQRESLHNAAARRGARIALPDEAALGKADIDPAMLMSAPNETLTSLLVAQGGEVVLAGRLAWNDDDLKWISDWRLDAGGRSHRWQVRSVTFDEAFRRGIGSAAQVLSGNGEPD